MILALAAVATSCYAGSVYAGGADIKLRQHVPAGKEHTIYWTSGIYNSATALIGQLQVLAQTEGTILNFISDPNDQQEIDIKVKKGDKLSDVLNQLVHQDSQYKWWENDGVVTVASKRLLNNSKFILNLTIDHLDLKGKNRREVIDEIQAWADKNYTGKYRVDSDGEKNQPVLNCIALSTKLKTAELSGLDINADGLTALEVLNLVSKKDNTYWTIKPDHETVEIGFSKDGTGSL